MKLALMVLALLLSVARALAAHPLHTTITELTEDRSRGVVRATVRVFADDFAAVIEGRSASTASSEAAGFRYVASAMTFADRSGRALTARSCGVRRTGDVLWLCLEVDAPAGLSALSFRNAMLCDRFEDQVNVVQSGAAGARRTLLFTRGDRPKPLS